MMEECHVSGCELERLFGYSLAQLGIWLVLLLC